VPASVEPAAPGAVPQTYRLTVLGTCDLHGNILNWDYYRDAEYDDPAHNDIGLAKISTLVAELRAERGPCATLLLDAGDTIQGTPLSYYYARVDPIDAPGGPVHPMAAAMNAVGFDAAALGNHEFNYGLDVLRRFESQLAHPLLGANALDWNTSTPAFREFVLKQVPLGEHRGHRPGESHEGWPTVTVGIVGLVTPGCAIWDKATLAGRISFNGIVEQARELIPRVRQAGADVVIVCCHSGASTSSSYGDALPWPENASGLLAEQVEGIDAILVGHTHVEIAQRLVTGPDGRQVLLSEPAKFGERLTVMDLELAPTGAGWSVRSATAHLRDARTVPEDPVLVELVREQQAAVRAYVNTVIGTSLAPMTARASRYQDSAAIAFVNHVQADTVRRALAGAAAAGLPVLSIAAPFNPTAAIPAGPVTVRDVAALYSYDNTLVGIVLSGAQVQDYLEHSAGYYRQVSGAGPFSPEQLTNAVTATSPAGTPDYNYDILAGLARPLCYDIDLARPAGSRVTGLRYGGEPVRPDQQFVVAINNYRQSGGGGFPAVTGAPVVYDSQVEIRQLIIDWVAEHRTLDPARFEGRHWRLVSDGQPLTVR
jgi:2',3'-cyclic-nucleotide 2'-phosphodiesterase/3'-nucleotidase